MDGDDGDRSDLISRVARLLEELEWEDWHRDYPKCPKCGGTKPGFDPEDPAHPSGHREGCEWRAILEAARKIS